MNGIQVYGTPNVTCSLLWNYVDIKADMTIIFINSFIIRSRDASLDISFFCSATGKLWESHDFLYFVIIFE